MKAKGILIIVDHLKHYLFKVDKDQNSFVNILIKFDIPESDLDHKFQILNHENFKLHILFKLDETSVWNTNKVFLAKTSVWKPIMCVSKKKTNNVISEEERNLKYLAQNTIMYTFLIKLLDLDPPFKSAESIFIRKHLFTEN